MLCGGGGALACHNACFRIIYRAGVQVACVKLLMSLAASRTLVKN